MLYTKCILAPRSVADGLRISVMSRHTLDDGVTPHPLITVASFDEWLWEFAPPATLIGAYLRREKSWEQYAEEYLAHLRQDRNAEMVGTLASCATLGDFTLLCIEKTPEQCHRRLLAEECQRHEPTLNIAVR